LKKALATLSETPEPGTPTTRYKFWTLDATITSPMQIGKIKGKYFCNVRAQTTNNLQLIKTPIYMAVRILQMM